MAGTEKDTSDSILAEWATSLCQHLQSQRPSAPMSNMLPRLLGPAVERHLRTIIESASKIQKRGKRSTLTIDDINFALQLAKEECVYGYASTKPNQITRWDGKDDVNWIPEHDVNLKEMFQSPLPSAPIAPSLSMHWLAVEGVQPDIVQNPSKKKMKKGSSSSSSSKIVHQDKQGNKEEEALVSHVLSHEMQLFFGKVTEALKCGIESQQKAALHSVATDSGIQELMPYFSQFIQTQVSSNLKDLPLLVTMMNLLRSLMNNPHVHLELYLHQLVPSVLTCIVGKKLCNDASTDDHWSLRDLAATVLATICARFGSVYSNLQPRITKALFEALSSDKPLTTVYGAITAISKLGALCVELLLLPVMTEIEARVEEDLKLPSSISSSKSKQGKQNKKSKQSSGGAQTRSELMKVTNASLRCRGALLNAITVLLNGIDVGSYNVSTSTKIEPNTESSSKKRSKNQKKEVPPSSSLSSSSSLLSVKSNPGRHHSAAKRLKKKAGKVEEDITSSPNDVSSSSVGVPSNSFGDALTPVYVKSLSKSNFASSLLIV